tara:strand:- start:34 stop:735 length:702 start_codon:yes stop_codon:yes gene_type:complete
MSNIIDINFNVYSDTPEGKDPDSYSSTLRNYHKILWSKPLPNGSIFNLDDKTPMLLHHKSELGEFFLSSDSIGHTYSRIQNMSHIINKVPSEEIESFFSLCSTIGGYIIYPSKRVDNQMTINGARGTNGKIKDRFDLTLECIRLHYINEESPLSDTLERYTSFFKLFDNFRGYIDFFLLQDLVTKDYSSIKYLIPFNSFENSPLPKDVDEYMLYKENMTDFITARNQRILNLK